MQNLMIHQSSLSGSAQETVSARDLHQSLEVKRDFSSWIRARIAKYGFTDGVDFCRMPMVVDHSQLLDSSGPQIGGPLESKTYGDARIEYFLSLDMAKELAMVENSDAGRAVRRYFISREAQARQLLLERAASSSRLSLREAHDQHLAKIQERQNRLYAIQNEIETLSNEGLRVQADLERLSEEGRAVAEHLALGSKSFTQMMFDRGWTPLPNGTWARRGGAIFDQTKHTLADLSSLEQLTQH